MDISTTLSAISAAKELASLIIGRKIDAAVTEKAIDLQNSIIALQSGLLEMQAQIQTLSQQNRLLEDAASSAQKWQEQEASHHLCAVAKGVHVYLATNINPRDETAVWYCANCWHQHFKSVLQRTGQDYGGTSYYCPKCNQNFYDHDERASFDK